MGRSVLIVAITLLSTIVMERPALAQADVLYKGKTLQILVGSAPGAGNNLKT